MDTDELTASARTPQVKLQQYPRRRDGRSQRDGHTSWGRVRLEPHQVPIDSNGNLTTKTEGSDTWGYEWNAENELTRVIKNSVEQARFAYDPLGRRVEKVAGGVTTTYTYDGEDILREVRGASTFKYVHGPGIDEPLAREDGSGALAYYQADGLGSIVKRTSQAGAVVHEYRYDAWGGIETGASEPGFSYTRREWDPEVVLYYYRARYYDPGIGRFISEDPIGLEGEDVNLYAYVWSNAVGYSDPHGLLAVKKDGLFPPTPPTGLLLLYLQCLERCVGEPLVVTSTDEFTRRRDPFNQATKVRTPHGRGQAADVRYPRWPNRAETKAFICCARICQFSFVLDEYRHPSEGATAPHFHVQIPPGRSGGSGTPPRAEDCVCKAGR